MSVYGKFIYAGDNLEDVFEVRRNVYQTEMDEMELCDQYDNIGIHVVIYTSGEPNKVVASGRVLMNDNIYCIDRIAVVNDEINNGYEELAVRMLANKAFNLGTQEIYTEVKSQSVPFFEGIGFRPIHDNFSETETIYIRMRLVSNDFYKECT
jgi:predicted GNAT family N-acyltransferase